MILVIPDIHNKIDAADELVRRVRADSNIFLGDYFDNFNDTAHDALNVAKWLKDRSRRDENIFLWGNHDFHYSPYAIVKGGGWRRDKRDAIEKVSPFRYLRFAASIENILLTHAGLSIHHWSGKQSAAELKNYINKADPRSSLIQGIGVARGGDQLCGGILWCDYRKEFHPIPLIRQIFGHTELREPPVVGQNINLDMQLRYYALIDNNDISVVENKTGG